VDQISYDRMIRLTSAPDGGILAGIAVIVDIEPADAGILVYGVQRDGDVRMFKLQGPRAEVELPFAWPRVLVKDLGALTGVGFTVVGYRYSKEGAVPLPPWFPRSD
jgi:hypothetical protein